MSRNNVSGFHRSTNAQMRSRETGLIMDLQSRHFYAILQIIPLYLSKQTLPTGLTPNLHNTLAECQCLR